jgi:dihydrofolate synthase/folylpolyglutamate synthase
MPATSSIKNNVPPQEGPLRFLMGRINYERSLSMPDAEEAFKLDRMRALLRQLGDPQNRLSIIHVAGTKGKGSTAAMMAAVLSRAGYRAGLFTSPHLDRVEERIVVEGQPCSSEEFAALVEQVRPAVETLDGAAAQSNPPEQGPTYFEILTAGAFCHFVRRKVDVVVLEVGLGGRLDSTNVCTPLISLITSISFDHVKQLGHTLAAIAAEKAGIIKRGVPVVSGVTADEPRAVVRDVARRNGCRLTELGVDFDVEYHSPQRLEQSPALAHFDFRCRAGTPVAGIALGLLGRHQAANAALVWAAVNELRQQGWTIPEAAVRRGLAEVVWPARVEVVARRPTVVLDAAHNAASVAALVEALAESFAARRRWLIFATTQEKDLRGMLERLRGQFDEVIFTRYLNNPRGVPPDQLQTLAAELFSAGLPVEEGSGAADDPALPAGRGSGAETGLPLPLASEGPGARTARTRIAPTPAEAWDFVHRLATPDDLICVTGSFFIAAEMRRQLAARPFSPGP